MNRIRIVGISVLLCGLAVYLILNSEISGIIGAMMIGLGIGVAMTGKFGKS